VRRAGTGTLRFERGDEGRVVTNAEEDDAVVDDGGGQSDVSAALRMRGVARFRRCVERAGGLERKRGAKRRPRVSERTTACVMTQDGRVAGIVAAACPSPRGAVLARARLRASTPRGK
jgi:hypothetical protein